MLHTIPALHVFCRTGTDGTDRWNFSFSVFVAVHSLCHSQICNTYNFVVEHLWIESFCKKLCVYGKVCAYRQADIQTRLTYFTSYVGLTQAHPNYPGNSLLPAWTWISVTNKMMWFYSNGGFNFVLVIVALSSPISYVILWLTKPWVDNPRMLWSDWIHFVFLN